MGEQLLKKNIKPTFMKELIDAKFNADISYITIKNHMYMLN